MKPIYILHEGNAKKTNDNLLIRLLIEELNKTNAKIDLNKIEFHGVGTKSNFFKLDSYPKNLRDGVETEQIDKVLFIVDADFEYPKKITKQFSIKFIIWLILMRLITLNMKIFSL